MAKVPLLAAYEAAVFCAEEVHRFLVTTGPLLPSQLIISGYSRIYI